MKLLVLNVHFAPFSFGGATIVAEEVINQLQELYDYKILVVTTIRDETILPYSIRRYQAKNVDIIGINILDEMADYQDLDNPPVTDIIDDVITHFQPDIVHAHSLQTMGCGFIDVIVKKNIPLVITVHDCWWICERQFMIASDGKYCFQKKIDLNRCAYCTDEYNKLIRRDELLRSHLNKTNLLLFPSEFHRQLYISNGFSENKCLLNKNGVRLAKPDYKKNIRSKDRIVFGFVGGPGEIKGADLIVKAFQEISSKSYELRIVDAAKNLGKSWQDNNFWSIPGKCKFVAPYSQDTMDSFFAEIDVLLFPSQWKESFGLTVREALARDVWVIATDAGGVTEDLVDGKNATIIPLDGDYIALKDAIETALLRTDWEYYKNPYRPDIRGFKDQAIELHNYFMTLFTKHF